MREYFVDMGEDTLMGDDSHCTLDVPCTCDPVGAVYGVGVIVDQVRVGGVEEGGVVPAAGAFGAPIGDSSVEPEEGRDDCGRFG